MPSRCETHTRQKQTRNRMDTCPLSCRKPTGKHQKGTMRKGERPDPKRANEEPRRQKTHQPVQSWLQKPEPRQCCEEPGKERGLRTHSPRKTGIQINFQGLFWRICCRKVVEGRKAGTSRDFCESVTGMHCLCHPNCVSSCFVFFNLVNFILMKWFLMAMVFNEIGF